MNILKFISGAIIFLFCVSCRQNAVNSSFQVSLVSLGKVDNSKIKFIQSILNENYNVDSIIIINQELPDETYYKPRNRYRADELIKYLKDNYQSDKVIGITAKDISTTSDKHEDWGIMGSLTDLEKVVLFLLSEHSGAQNRKNTKMRD